MKISFEMPVVGMALWSAVFVGCGVEGPATGTVAGRITYNSQPVAAGMVVFENPSQALIKVAELDTDGHYHIQDVPVAEYVVSIQPPQPKLPSESDGSPDEIRAKLAGIKNADPANIPRRVRTTQTSPLRADIMQGAQEKNFELADAAK